MSENVKIQARRLPLPAVVERTPPAEDPEEGSSSSPEMSKDATNIVGATPPIDAATSSTPAVPVEIEKGSAEEEQQRLTAKGKKDIEFGAVVAVFSFAVMLAGFFLSPAAAKGPAENWRLDIPMLLAFASFICGFSFMLLSMQLLGAPEIQVSCHRVMSRCLFYACIILPAFTLLSLLVVMPFKPYVYIGLAVLAVFALPVAIVHCYVSRRTAEGAPEEAGESGDQTEGEAEDQTEEMEASFKITAAMAASSFAGLVGMLFGVYKHSGGAGTSSTTPGAVHVAIMFMFSTAVVSMLLMMLSMKVLEINNQKLRHSIVRAIKHFNAVLLFWLAIAALSAAFVIIKFYILAALVSLAIAAIVHVIIHNCTRAQGQVDRGRQGDGNTTNHNQATQLKWMSDIASKVTAYSLGGVMAIFGGFLGGSDDSHDKMVAIKICMFLMTSAFASGLGLMLLTTRSGSPARVGFKAATTILAWSAMGLLAAAALAIYGVEVMKS